MAASLVDIAVTCPCCGERIVLLIDPSIPEQQYVEDCSVCCRPIQVLVSVDMEGQWTVQLKHENDV